MGIENKPRRKRIFDKEDPHFSGTLIVFSIITAFLFAEFCGSYHYNPMQIVVVGMALITFVYLIISLNYPQKPRWLWYLGIVCGALLVCFGIGVLGFLF